MNEYLEVLKKYVVFSGRSARKEYFMFVLIHIIVILVLDVVSWAIKMPLGVIYALAVILPSFGLTVRRLHDIGKSGWWCLIGLVPVVGTVVLVVFAVMDSQTGDNQYGPNPKGVPAV